MSHEYVILNGINRTHVGRYLFAAATAVSGVLTWVLVNAIALARSWTGWASPVPPIVISAVGVAAVYWLLYLFFSRWVWKWHPVARLLNLPDLDGVWDCEGTPFSRDGSAANAWSACITIEQNWDRCRIYMRSERSSSDSLVAALLPDKVAGCSLLYSYQNHPKPGDPDLSAHRGFVRLTFAPDLQTATGDYFTGDGRHSSGYMTIRRSHGKDH